MVKTRFSRNQNDALFILALLETKQFNGAVPVAKMRTMISQPRDGELDASNFRKSLHALEDKGCIELLRARDLSLAAKLTRVGRHQAAKVYRERTGKELDVPPVDDEQMTIFDNED
ncbi:chromosome segregation protein ParM [Vibrio sp. 1636]|uniref:Chromosome segregation protein ParM n=1 Tax=Vibrio alginolyticus TaxID=663 RepID=A0A7Y0MZE2_VIBAL|nr:MULTISPECIES: chromosome segregation protein ParM [Vibrio]MDW2204281.1 chromosome segregation protein ParM [Vibrio sp. 1636]NMR76217.1 chromosome segregation protein ParM [Vibrio alginolyticus]